jgi:hypothetical protein
LGYNIAAAKEHAKSEKEGVEKKKRVPKREARKK